MTTALFVLWTIVFLIWLVGSFIFLLVDEMKEPTK